ncbi:MAG: SWIM zinc finger domain-containing protein [Desulfovibrionales bacterium]|nr:SWIM zinc finger domain-containing protein [Desulfovibrionales bacterium]
MVTLTAKSSSGGTYQVTFAMEGERFSARCTCKAGIMGNLCKHRIALLAGDAKMLANPEQVTDMQRVAEWAKQAGIHQACKEIAEAQSEVARAQEKVKKLKRVLLERIT